MNNSDGKMYYGMKMLIKGEEKLFVVGVLLTWKADFKLLPGQTHHLRAQIIYPESERVKNELFTAETHPVTRDDLTEKMLAIWLPSIVITSITGEDPSLNQYLQNGKPEGYLADIENRYGIRMVLYERCKVVSRRE